MAEHSSRLNEKVRHLSKWVSELEEIIPSSFNKYKTDNLVSAACERYCERIIEDLIIISNIILKEKGVVERERCFDLLHDLDVLNKDLAAKLENIKGMRNLMIHQYDTFDEELFFDSLKELIKDSKHFMESVNSFN